MLVRSIFQTSTGEDLAPIAAGTVHTLESNTVNFVLVTDFCAGDVKPQVLTMQYTGKDCSASSNPLTSSCQGDPNSASPVHIIAHDKQNPFHKKAKKWFDDSVDLNTTFDIDATFAGKTRLGGDTHVSICDDAQCTTLLQKVKFHTSCSDPLNAGDQFGGVKLLEFTPE